MQVRLLLLPLLVLSIWAVGCSSKAKPIPVEGIVTLDNKPLEGAEIEFQPLDKSGMRAFGVSGSDGSFRLTTLRSNDGALPGEYKVLVSLKEANPKGTVGPSDGGDPKQVMEAMKKSFDLSKKKDTKSASLTPKSRLSPNYGDPEKSKLRQTIPLPDGEAIKLDLRSSGS